jgi:hypothetical protein
VQQTGLSPACIAQVIRKFKKLRMDKILGQWHSGRCPKIAPARVRFSEKWVNPCAINEANILTQLMTRLNSRRCRRRPTDRFGIHVRTHTPANFKVASSLTNIFFTGALKMSTVSNPITDGLGRANREPKPGFLNLGTKGSLSESHTSGVSWAAIIAGAVTASALSLALLALGAGFGFSAMSPWTGQGASASTIGAASIAWLIGTQVVAAAMGGYLAGRLRTKWAGVHSDEVFFRDTAHGFLVWAVGVVITASILASAASMLAGGVAKAGTALVGASAGGMAVGMGSTATNASIGSSGSGAIAGAGSYLVDSLFRSDRPGATPATAGGDESATRAEVLRIISNGVNDMPASDKAYLSQLIAAKTGIAPVDAEKRVNDLITQIKSTEVATREAADTARKAAAKLSLWTFIGLLIGAFCASLAATFGGRQRDDVYA